MVTPVLNNQRRELFCQSLVQGLTQTQAYINAGFSAKSAESAASRLAKNVKVKSRIVELQALIVKVGETGLTNSEMQAQREPALFVRARVNDRQYRITLLAEMIDELRAPEARVRRDGGPNVAAYREARECLKQVAIETGEWQEEGRVLPPATTIDYSDYTDEQLINEQVIMREARERLEANRAGRPPAKLLEAAPGTVEEVSTAE
jgi:hypothetical protein